MARPSRHHQSRVGSRGEVELELAFWSWHGPRRRSSTEAQVGEHSCDLVGLVGDLHQLGHSDGQIDVFDAGYVDGYDGGYIEGYDAAYYDCLDQAYPDGFDDGYAAGWDASLGPGFDDGYASGFEDGRAEC